MCNMLRMQRWAASLVSGVGTSGLLAGLFCFAASRLPWACRRGDNHLLKFKASVRVGKKEDLNDSECGPVGLWCQTGWSEYFTNCCSSLSSKEGCFPKTEKIFCEWQRGGKRLVDIRGECIFRGVIHIVCIKVFLLNLMLKVLRITASQCAIIFIIPTMLKGHPHFPISHYSKCLKS